MNEKDKGAATAGAPVTAASVAPTELEQLAATAAAGEAPQVTAEAPAPAAPKVATAEMLASLLTPTFAILAPNWGVTQADCKMLGEAWGVVLDKWFPDLDFGPEVTAIMVTAIVFAPRYGKPLKLPPKEDSKKQAEPA